MEYLFSSDEDSLESSDSESLDSASSSSTTTTDSSFFSDSSFSSESFFSSDTSSSSVPSNFSVSSESELNDEEDAVQDGNENEGDNEDDDQDEYEDEDDDDDEDFDINNYEPEVQKAILLYLKRKALVEAKGTRAPRTKFRDPLWQLRLDGKGDFFYKFPLIKQDNRKFYEYMRMKKETFDYVLKGIESSLVSYTKTKYRISAEEKLVITLRFVFKGLLS